MNVFSWRFWLPIIVGGVVFALVLPLMLRGQESKEVGMQFTVEERMSIKDKQTEYWRLQAQAASILLQAEKLQLELSNVVSAMQARCVKGGGRFDLETVSCTRIPTEGKKEDE